MSGTAVHLLPGLWIDFQEGSMRARAGQAVVGIELERQENGQLTAKSRERVVEELRGLLRGSPGKARLQAYAAVGARGVSLRRVKLPGASREETRKLLRLQIEREFPLGPEALAWGYQPLENGALGTENGRRGQEVLVAAVKRAVVEEYTELLRECGAQPLMTVGAFARTHLVPGGKDSFAMLELGRAHAELTIVENGALESVRLLRWPGGAPEGGKERPQADRELVWRGLAEKVRALWSGPKLYLTGEGARLPALRSCLERVLGAGSACEWLDPGTGEGGSATIAGLSKAWARNGGVLPLVLESESAPMGERAQTSGRWRWAAVLGLIVLGFVSVRYAEGLVLHGRLAKRLEEVRAYRDTLPKKEGDLAFLQYLKTNQVPYLDAFFALAEAAPAGMRIETLSLNRRGELAMRTTLRDPPQVAEFRSRLVQSGLFESVALEEQTMAANRQGVNARFVGRWKTSGNSP
jgi:hypothetical protein